ncbi:MAG: hypothetical protein ACR2NP_21165, partial [Pirellulaceae bacterium]
MNKSFLHALIVPLGATLLLAAFSTSGNAQTTNDVTQSGRVFTNNSWLTPEEVAESNLQNETLAEYARTRSETPDTFAGQMRLARWCADRSLDQRQDAHLQRALAHDPENRRAHSLLGHVRRDGEWYSSGQLEAQKQASAAARQRYRDWRQPIREIARQMRSHSERQRESGTGTLQEISDPRSVTALEMILAAESDPIASQAVETIHQFPQREASESLLRIALMHASERVREHALDLLATRNRYDFVPEMIGEL